MSIAPRQDWPAIDMLILYYYFINFLLEDLAGAAAGCMRAHALTFCL